MESKIFVQYQDLCLMKIHPEKHVNQQIPKQLKYYTTIGRTIYLSPSLNMDTMVDMFVLVSLLEVDRYEGWRHEHCLNNVGAILNRRTP